jgi:hypothetical protein
VDAREVLQAIERDPVLRAEARRVILTDELLALPALVQESARQIAALVGLSDQQRAELTELKSMFGRFIEGTGEVLARIERVLEDHTRILENHTIRLTRIEERLG